MKNIFKSLMFVAVAAMTFTACEKDNAENNNNNGTEQKTAITFNAEFADTRSYFTGNNGEGYASAWTEGDEATFAVNTYDSGWGYWYGKDTKSANIDANNCFSVDLYVGYGDKIIAYTPASQWNVTTGSDGYTGNYAIPGEQTPTATSVDPKAHILMAEATYTGSNNMSLTFAHQVAYGKMSLTNFAGTGATAVLLDIDGTKYTIKLDNINIATEPIWFACEPNGKVSNMTVTVNATEGSYTKQIITGGNKNLEFLQGQVSTFIVDMKDVTSGAAVDTFNPTVTYDTLVWNSTRFELKGGNSAGVTQLILHENARPGNNSIKVGPYTYDGYSSTYESPSAENMFRLRNLEGSSMRYASGVTLDVSFENNQYTIIIGYNGKTYGYRGLPNGWVAPAGGGNEGGNEGGEEPEPEPVQLDTPKNVNWTVTDANVTITWDAVDNASSYNVTLGEQTQNVNTATATFSNVAAGTYNVKVVAVGTGNYTNSEAANAEVTVEAAEEPIIYDPWECKKIGNYSGDMWGYTVTVQGTGSNTDTIVLSGLRVGNAPIDITATKDGVPGEGKGYIVDGEYRVVFDVTIGNVTYRGTTSNSII